MTRPVLFFYTIESFPLDMHQKKKICCDFTSFESPDSLFLLHFSVLVTFCKMPQDFQSEFSKSETLFAPVFARTVNVKRLKAACLHGTLSSAVRSWFNTGWDTTTLTSFLLGGLFSCSPKMLEVAKESGFNAREWSA